MESDKEGEVVVCLSADRGDGSEVYVVTVITLNQTAGGTWNDMFIGHQPNNVYLHTVSGVTVFQKVQRGVGIAVPKSTDTMCKKSNVQARQTKHVTLSLHQFTGNCCFQKDIMLGLFV